MHPCPCCGHKTLPERAAYDLCPVCWWEDDGVAPWEFSGPNNQTLAEAQEQYLADRRPHRARPGKVRAPRRKEARDPGWRPHRLTDEQRRRIEEEKLARERAWAEEERRTAEELAADPEGPFREYNAAMDALEADVPSLSHAEVKARLRERSLAHGLFFSAAHLELLARRLEDESFYRRHPVHAAWWLLRHSRPGIFRQRWRELRTGVVHFAG